MAAVCFLSLYVKVITTAFYSWPTLDEINSWDLKSTQLSHYYTAHMYVLWRLITVTSQAKLVPPQGITAHARGGHLTHVFVPTVSPPT
jgi:hypothetical protein